MKSRRNLFPVKDSRKSIPTLQPNFLTIQHKDESFQSKQEHEPSIHSTKELSLRAGAMEIYTKPNTLNNSKKFKQGSKSYAIL